MRKRGILLLLLTLGLAVLVAAGVAAASPPGASYPWAQPGTVTPASVSVQPPASVPIAVPTVEVLAPPAASYPWAQPGAALPTGAPSAQPPPGIIP
jgi:hypothetical protein